MPKECKHRWQRKVAGKGQKLKKNQVELRRGKKVYKQCAYCRAIATVE